MPSAERLSGNAATLLPVPLRLRPFLSLGPGSIRGLVPLRINLTRKEKAMLLIPLALTILVGAIDYIVHEDLTYKFGLVSVAIIWIEYLMIALSDVYLGW